MHGNADNVPTACLAAIASKKGEKNEGQNRPGLKCNTGESMHCLTVRRTGRKHIGAPSASAKIGIKYTTVESTSAAASVAKIVTMSSSIAIELRMVLQRILKNVSKTW